MSGTEWLTLGVRLRFTSDWHVGDGTGQPGHIDRMARRDPEDAVPYVPAKTLAGVWRDACEAIAAGLDGQAAGQWSRMAAAIFGDEPGRRRRPISAAGPQRARLSMTPARFPASLRAALRRPSPFAEAVTFVKPGVKIDPDTGAAVDEHLRFEEVVRGGGTLEAVASVDVADLDERQVKAVRALLWAGAASLERLGGKRRRGYGRCVLEVPDLAHERGAHLEQLSHEAPDLPPPSVATIPVPDSRPLATDAASGWTIVPLTIRLLGPVIIPLRAAGNVVRSMDHVPGTYFLGHVTRILQPHLGDSVFAHVARGDLRISHAYLDIEGVRGRPVPLALHHWKDEVVTPPPIVNLAQEQLRADEQATVCTGFIGAFDGRLRPVLERTPLQHTTHATIDDEAQRPTAAVGGVYTYEAIRPGTVLQAEVRMRNNVADLLAMRGGEWWRELAGTLRLGVAKKDDYGSAVIEVTQPRGAAPDVHAARDIIVWLLSDVLLRDEGLRPSASVDVFAQHLAERLAEPSTKPSALGDAENRAPAGVSAKIHQAFARTRRSEGWNVRWGLPRPPYIGLAAGSCIMLRIEEEASASLSDRLQGRLREIEAEGVGERRAEGFGEISINDPLVTTALSALPAGAAASRPVGESPSPILHDEDLGYARLVERMAWHAAIRRGAVELAADDAWRQRVFGWTGTVDPRPKNSQLGGLRALITALSTAEDGVRIVTWLTAQRRKDAWPRQSLETIPTLLTDPGIAWRWLRGTVSGARLDYAMTTNSRDALEPTLWAEAVRIIVLSSIRSEQRHRESARAAAATRGPAR